jgi:hypothetical protein
MKNYFLATITIIFLMLTGCGGASINTTAHIAKSGNGFIIILSGKGTGHPAGFSDLFFPKTFDDSIELSIYKSYDTINYSQVIELYPISKNVFDTIKFSKGKIIIKDNFLKVDLYSTYPDYPPNDPLNWNGDYELKWRE